MNTRIYEGVPYYPYRVRFKLADGRRRSWVRWAPARYYMIEAVCRELEATFGADGVKAFSCTVRPL